MEKQTREKLAWEQPAHTDTPREGPSLPYLNREQVLPREWMDDPPNCDEVGESEDIDIHRNRDTETQHSHRPCKRNEK